MAVAVVYLLV